MELEGKRVLLVGATGGIGSCLSEQLLEIGSRLGLVGLVEEELEELETALDAPPSWCAFIRADVTKHEDRSYCMAVMESAFGGVDVLINLAGINAFVQFDSQRPEQIEKIIQVNVVAPMLMTQAVLPLMKKQGGGLVVNVGSTFGSIGFPCFTTYSASKFAMRGFSQALRREFSGRGIKVLYVAPRAVRTAMNPPAVYEMATKINMQFDEPEYVARQIVTAIRKERKELFIGFPESLFARVNALLPGIVDRALNRQAPILRQYAER